jgi:hypothetical protein
MIIKEFLRSGDEGLRSVLYQEIFVAKAPEYTDAGDAGIMGGFNIDIAIADIHGGCSMDPRGSEGEPWRA